MCEELPRKSDKCLFSGKMSLCVVFFHRSGNRIIALLVFRALQVHSHEQMRVQSFCLSVTQALSFGHPVSRVSIETVEAIYRIYWPSVLLSPCVITWLAVFKPYSISSNHNLLLFLSVRLLCAFSHSKRAHCLSGCVGPIYIFAYGLANLRAHSQKRSDRNGQSTTNVNRQRWIVLNEIMRDDLYALARTMIELGPNMALNFAQVCALFGGLASVIWNTWLAASAWKPNDANAEWLCVYVSIWLTLPPTPTTTTPQSLLASTGRQHQSREPTRLLEHLAPLGRQMNVRPGGRLSGRS